MSDYGDAIDDVRAALADAAGDILPDRCTVNRPGSEVHDEQGEVGATPAPAYTDLPCDYAPVTGRERFMADIVAAVSDFTMRFPATADVRPKDKVTVAARGTHPERTFQVKARLPGSYELYMRVLASRS